MSDVNCPYCDHKFEVCRDDGHGTDESETYEQECPECEKVFALTVAIHFRYSAEKADCMNDGPHNFREDYNPLPWNVGNPFCRGCGNHIMIDKPANEKAMVEWRKTTRKKVDEVLF